ncbi:hypothetical protein NLI96_g7343 [Meripilus lineatus]|uniref:Sulfhydryl oxidase n=1 Tax=Meripilus lineatus TaxID=2056292 RepID=A0AAD5YHA7_9APHY|nr:hypothetical protein NLI96_g7343 [Physisporinus lineatus]
MAETSFKTPSSSLPPGMVMGPDGKPCTVCTSFKRWRLPAKARNQTYSQNASSTAPKAAGTAAAAASIAAVAKPTVDDDEDPRRPEHCPPDIETLGRATWTFLHTTAAYYPDKPSPTQRANMLCLLRALPVVYACSHCGGHLGKSMERHPPDVSSRLGLSRWLCQRHNEVNKYKGKEIFDCTLEKLNERWRDGPSDGSCDSDLQ